MKKKTKVILALIIVIILGCLIDVFLVNKNVTKDTKETNITTEQQANTTELTSQEQKEIIESIKNETGLQAESSLYEVDTEYDGRKVLNIKASVQYKVAFAGIIKKQKPKMDEVDSIVNNNHPTKNGIWVEEKSRNQILELISTNTNSTYKIDNEGYLYIESKNNQNEYDKSLEELINQNGKMILTISNLYYEVDNVTGEIVEYPFEKLDNYQAYDKIESEENSIIVITTNSMSKLTNKQILDEVLQIKK